LSETGRTQDTDAGFFRNKIVYYNKPLMGLLNRENKGLSNPNILTSITRLEASVAVKLYQNQTHSTPGGKQKQL